MSAYLQMGHDSWNLVDKDGLRGFSGILLSPVNDGPLTVIQRLLQMGELRDELEVILDPQLYKPTSDRGKLAEWEYFSSALDTIDLADLEWWMERARVLAASAAETGVDAVCSPAMLPKVFSDEYYDFTLQVADGLALLLAEEEIEPLLTAIVQMQSLGTRNEPERLASLLSRTSIGRIYLVFHDQIPPRENREDFRELAGAMRLISLLESAGSRVLTAFSGLDALLWKRAGSTDVATGKFFNLRRFVAGRWDDPKEGGRIVPYWTDPSLITWLREADVRLLDESGFLERGVSESNPYAVQILEILKSNTGKPWFGLAWRQYLHWFHTIEAAQNADRTYVDVVLRLADKFWADLESEGVLLFDRKNDGRWIRPWLNAIRLSGV